MSEQVVSTDALSAFILKILRVDKILVRESNNVVTIKPVAENTDCTVRLRGILADCPEISVVKFIEHKHADKKLDL